MVISSLANENALEARGRGFEKINSLLVVLQIQERVMDLLQNTSVKLRDDLSRAMLACELVYVDSFSKSEGSCNCK